TGPGSSRPCGRRTRCRTGEPPRLIPYRSAGRPRACSCSSKEIDPCRVKRLAERGEVGDPVPEYSPAPRTPVATLPATERNERLNHVEIPSHRMRSEGTIKKASQRSRL